MTAWSSSRTSHIANLLRIRGQGLMNEAQRRHYYQHLDRLFFLLTGLLILFCLVCVVVLPLSVPQQLQASILIFLASVFTGIRYSTLRRFQGSHALYYLTDIVNPLLIGLLIAAAGRYGLYLYFLFFLQLAGSIATLRLRHVAISAGMSGLYSLYLFFVTNTFELDGVERVIAGSVLIGVLVIVVAFIFFLVRELVTLFEEMETRKLQFVQDASHELRTPLTVIKAFSALLRDERSMDGRDSRHWGQNERDMQRHFESATHDLEHLTEKLSVSSKERLEL